MSALHLVNRPAALASCIARASAADTIVLLDDGVYAGAGDTAPAECAVMAIGDDVAARGISELLHEGVSQISYSTLVQLCVDHQPIITWSR